MNTCVSATAYTFADENNVIHSKHAVELDEKQNLYHFVTKNFSLYSENCAYVDAITNERTTYKQVSRISRNLGLYLSNCGYGNGDVFATILPNCGEYLACLLAAWGLGGAITPANPQCSSTQLTQQLIQTEAKVVFANEETVHIAKESCKDVQVNILVFGKVYEDSEVVSLEEILENDSPDQFTIKDCDISTTVACIPHTSGTTGPPKGVLVTQRNIMATMAQRLIAMGPPADRNLAAIPPFFTLPGILDAVNSLIYGKMLVILSKIEPQLIFKAIQVYKVQYSVMVDLLLNHPEAANYDLSSLQHIIGGGSPIDADTITSFLNKFPSIKAFQQGYGSSEAGMTHLQPLAFQDQVPTSIGVNLPSTAAKICDLSTGKSLGPFKNGELMVKSPTVMKGYMNNCEANTKCFTSDGWYRCEDYGYYDNNHNFFVLDRVKDLISCDNLLKVSPGELELLLNSHTDIIEAAVIGVPALCSSSTGEIPLAFIVRRSGSQLSEQDVKEFVTCDKDGYKQLSGGVKFCDEILRGPSGKILKKVLREDYLAGKYS